ncbi:uncharacterized protein LOC111711750 isoform X1 [Eurytemora carolleeae]|uniref:uncharacterized protein LOC111711750 isoform X1 n=1 Tax=Eurytemora carolleeae TaxID=1294199 RepID=UPI000C785A2B|nr:uncharacterized protein LOC111711750 isoform X1 [Eurytemora carolleeae]|eukprot:XP_023341943.1 uncharacterized protein LOC111711750 isoform X1 [Eurytemora affinis]
MELKTSFLVLSLLFVGGECIKCKVGVGPLTKDLDCKGDWTTMRASVEGLVGSVSNYSSIFSANAGGLVSSGINQISNTLGRKKRQAVTPAPVTTTMNPETEYYCLKHVILGTNTRSCAPKSFLNLTSPLCKTATIGDVCACNNVDFCNTGAMPMAGLLLILACLAIFA